MLSAKHSCGNCGLAILSIVGAVGSGRASRSRVKQWRKSNGWQNRIAAISETMDAWRTSYPRLPVWEEASERELIELDAVAGTNVVRITRAGRASLEEHRLAKL